MIKICIKKSYKGILELRSLVDGQHKDFRPFREVLAELGKMEDMMKFLQVEKSICPIDLSRWLQIARILEMPIHIATEAKINHLSPRLKVHHELIPRHKYHTHVYVPLAKIYPDGKVKHLHPRHASFGIYRDIQDGEILIMP